MQKFILLSIFVTAIAAMPFDMLELNDKVAMINKQKLGWTATHYNRKFPKPGVLPGYKAVKMPRKAFADSELADLPANWDVRMKWPQCNAVFNNIRNQGQCGSCWAVSSASVFSDRKCIASNAAVQTSFSGEDTLSCCTYMGSAGCDGGWPAGAWSWFTDVGVVSGGSYSSDAGCKPYSFCSPEAESCSTPTCQDNCFGTMAKNSYMADKHKAYASYRVTPNAVSMQKELYSQGSLVVSFAVYDDFYNYKDGVYIKSANATLDGYHAVRLIGWGTENGVDYWLIANSWGADWGINGFFKIQRGVDMVEIEDDPVAGLVSSN